MAKIKVRVNKENCISCGSCYASFPEVFAMDDDGTAKVVDQFNEVEITDPVMIEKAKSAKDMCPNMAIEIEELPE